MDTRPTGSAVPLEDQPPEALAALVDYVRTIVEAHLEMHPHDAPCLPIMDDQIVVQCIMGG